MNRAEITTTEVIAPSFPMRQIWRTIRDYVLWSHDRGTIQYDIMVSLILLFVFLSPRLIDFHDKPPLPNVHPNGLIVSSDDSGNLIYEVDQNVAQGSDDSHTRANLVKVIAPVSGSVSINRYEFIQPSASRAAYYRVWAKRLP